MHDKKLVQQFLEGKCTPEEETLFRKYLADDKADLSLIMVIMSEAWDNIPETGTTVSDAQKDELLVALRHRLYPEEKVETGKVVPLPKRTKRIWYSVAASLLTVGMASWWMLGNLRKTPPHVENASTATTWKTLTNNDSRVKYAMLPDSSKVWLHPHSILAYDMQYNGQQRAIRLQGEAFFDVSHDEKHPFMVYTGDIATKVLGTAFNVEAWSKEASIRVSLVRGKVALEDSAMQNQQPLQVLQAGEMADYNKQQHTSAKADLKIRSIEEYTKGYLVCNDLLVTDALERVASRYNMKIVYTGNVNLQGKRITTVFKNETVGQMLNIILFVSKCKYTMKNQVITVSET